MSRMSLRPRLVVTTITVSPTLILFWPRGVRMVPLRLMQQIGVDTTNWIRVNAFCLDKRIAGKRFAELDCEELETLAVKLRGIVRKDERKSEVKKTSCHVVLIKPNIRES